MKQADQWLSAPIWQVLATIVTLTTLIFAILYWFVPNYIMFVIPLTIATIVFGTLAVISQARGMRARKIERQSPPFKITLQIDDEPITIEISDANRVNEILQIVKDLQTDSSSNVEARTKVSQPPDDSSS